MKILTEEFIVETKGNCDIIDITGDVISQLKKSKLSQGSCNIFVVGSTAGISTIEYEPGLLKDVPEFLEQITPTFKNYSHNDTWGDGNGHSHLRSFLIKTSLTVPFKEKELILGTWQQIVLLDFDNRPRTRRIIVQLIGE